LSYPYDRLSSQILRFFSQIGLWPGGFLGGGFCQHIGLFPSLQSYNLYIIGREAGRQFFPCKMATFLINWIIISLTCLKEEGVIAICYSGVKSLFKECLESVF
jgi:hypothetical protein